MPWRRSPKETYFRNIASPVLELGPGNGANFRRYHCGTLLTAIEPDTTRHRRLHRQAEKHGLNLTLLADPSALENLPSESFSSGVGSLILCTVPNAAEALRHIHRTLVPGGRYYFMEHVLAPPGTRKHGLQQRFNPVFSTCLAACECNRPLDHLITATFPDAEYEHFTAPGRFYLNNLHVVGVATKPLTPGDPRSPAAYSPAV